MSLLVPWAEVAGYGSFGQAPVRAGALALRGRPVERYIPIEFPPAGASFPIAAMTWLEWPNPLTPCDGYQVPVGLPVTLEIGGRRSAQLGNCSLIDSTTGQPVASCRIR